MIDLFGPVPVPVSPSPQQAKARRPMTNATCGLAGFLSSASAALQSSLESRLRQLLDGAGSTLFSLIWKRKSTPAGRPYSQLVVSARRISGNEFSFTQTLCARDARSLAGARDQRRKPTPGESLASAIGRSLDFPQQTYLDPRKSGLWMGFPETWVRCAPTATRSSRKSQPPSSEPSSSD